MPVRTGPCETVLKDFPDAHFDHCISDPPYGMGLLDERWDSSTPGVAALQEIYRVLKPGGWVVLFTSSYGNLIQDFLGVLDRVGFEMEYRSIYWAHHKAPSFVAPLPGHPGSYPGQALRNIIEQIIVARKPGVTRLRDGTVLPHGKSNLDATRIPRSTDVSVPTFDDKSFGYYHRGKGARKTTGRKHGHDNMPTNLAVSDSALANDSQYYDIDRWYAERVLNLTDLTADGKHLPSNVAQTFPVLVCPRVTVQERERGCKRISPALMESAGKRKALQKSNPVHNNHPSLKPIRLMCWLVQLFTDPGQTVLDPFCGAGSTGIACKMLGRDFVGIDQNKRYSQIARARLRVWPAPRVNDPIPDPPTYEGAMRRKPNEQQKEVSRQLAELELKIRAMGGFRIARLPLEQLPLCLICEKPVAKREELRLWHNGDRLPYKHFDGMDYAYAHVGCLDQLYEHNKKAWGK